MSWMPLRAILRGLALCTVFLGAACSNGEFPDNPVTVAQQTVCVPGLSVACACAGEVTGVAVCVAGGAGFGACQCPDGLGGTTAMFPAGGAGGVAPLTGGTDVAPTGGTGPVPTGGAPAGTGGSLDTGGEFGMTGGTGGLQTEASIAGDVLISEVAIYQAVKVPLAKDGEPVAARNAPVISNKAALLRVFLEPLPGFAPRELEVELTLASAEGQAASQTLRKSVSGASSEATLSSTVNFELPSDSMPTDLRYSVTVRETGGAGTRGTRHPDARFPRSMDALLEMGARDPGPFRVVIVPYRFLPDRSNRLPDMSAATLEFYRAYLSSLYPVSEVQFEVRDSVDDYTGVVSPNTGWENWLDDLCSLRDRENSDPKVFYYGFMNPAATMRAYGGGIVGISYSPDPASNFGRCSVGIGFAEDISALTMAHELGHALGLPHAPCGVDGGPFPYAGASIGTWGYSVRTSSLRDPATYTDMMSYCDPAFISDYNYQKLFERVRYLNLQFDRAPISLLPVTYHRILQYRDGGVRVVGRNERAEPPGSSEALRTVELLDESGASLGEAEAYFLPTGEDTGGVWFVPDTGAAAVVLGSAGKVWLP